MTFAMTFIIADCRIIWSILLLISFVLAALSLVAVFGFVGDQQVSVVPHALPVQQAPFPAITICTETKAKKSIVDFTNAYIVFQTDNTSNYTNDE